MEEVVAKIWETTVAGRNALETTTLSTCRCIPSSVLPSLLVSYTPPFPSCLCLHPQVVPGRAHLTMISFDWLTSDHRETHTSERAPPQPRSLAWQPSPSPLRHESSTLQYHPLSSPPPPLPLSPAVWSNLPIELVTQILLYAAFASRADAHAFCLVSSAVRRAVLPALYHNVLLRSASQVPAFVSPFTAKQRRPPYHYYPSPTHNGSGGSSPNSKLLAHIPIHALALALPTKRPSLEVALARTAPALASLEHLALTAPLLGAHAHWLRAAPHVRPRTLTLYHLGRPAPVHFGEPFLRNVTHLYTSTLCGFRGTSPASLPSLTHIALSTRATQPPSVIDEVLAAARRMLNTCPHLVMLVLSLDSTGSTSTPTAIAASAAAAAATAGSCAHGGIGTAAPSIITLPVPWRAALARQRDPRLHILPFALHARIMWWDVVAGGEGSGVQDVFACAQAWRDAEARGATSVMLRLAAEAALRNAALDSWKEDEWDLDLMTAPGYVHGRSADEGETDTREFPPLQPRIV